MAILYLEKLKRLAIYFFYDESGIVDDYVPYFLADLKKNISYLVVVCNGFIDDEGRDKLNMFADQIIVRENKGFDAWAYKCGIETLGWRKISGFDELILLNFTIMGPLFPLSEMFDCMDSKEIDFWGITEYAKVDPDPHKLCKYGYLPKHIQSHFIAIKNKLLKSVDFRSYWDNLPVIESYQQSICFHEAVFTKTFEDLGYKWETFVGSRFDDYCDNMIINAPVKLIKEGRCPIFKRRSFFHNYSVLLTKSLGNSTFDLLEYIKNNTNYDLNLIWKNILRTVPQFDYYKLAGLVNIIPVSHKLSESSVKLHIGLVMHIYYQDLFESCFQYALSTPEEVDILITISNKNLLTYVEKRLLSIKTRKINVICVENRGRDVSALLIGAKDFIRHYDLICFIHDKKVTQLESSIKGENFSKLCYDNILYNRVFSENIIEIFKREPQLGMLNPPIPNFAEYFRINGLEWGRNFENTKALASKLGLNIPVKKDKPPIAPFGTMFWFRVAALQKIFDFGWYYEDFPSEPADVDGTIMHAIERVYSFVAQESGYYSSTAVNEEFAKRELINRGHMLREILSSLLPYFSNPNFLSFSTCLTEQTNLLYFSKSDDSKSEYGNQIALSISPFLSWRTIIKIFTRKILGSNVYELLHRLKRQVRCEKLR